MGLHPSPLHPGCFPGQREPLRLSSLSSAAEASLFRGPQRPLQESPSISGTCPGPSSQRGQDFWSPSLPIPGSKLVRWARKSVREIHPGRPGVPQTQPGLSPATPPPPPSPPQGPFLNLRLSRVLDARQGQRVSLEGEPWSARGGQGAAWAEGTGPGPWQGCWVGGAGVGQGSAPLRSQLPETKAEPRCTGLGGGPGAAPQGLVPCRWGGWTPGACRLEEGGAPGQEAVFPEVPPAGA